MIRWHLLCDRLTFGGQVWFWKSWFVNGSRAILQFMYYNHGLRNHELLTSLAQFFHLCAASIGLEKGISWHLACDPLTFAVQVCFCNAWFVDFCYWYAILWFSHFCSAGMVLEAMVCWLLPLARFCHLRNASIALKPCFVHASRATLSRLCSKYGSGNHDKSTPPEQFVHFCVASVARQAMIPWHLSCNSLSWTLQVCSWSTWCFEISRVILSFLYWRYGSVSHGLWTHLMRSCQFCSKCIVMEAMIRWHLSRDALIDALQPMPAMGL